MQSICKYKFTSIIIIVLSLYSITMIIYSGEVKTRREMIEKYDDFSSQKNEPFIFTILQDNKLCLEHLVETYYETVEPPKYPYDYQCITQAGVKNYIRTNNTINQSFHKTRFANNSIRPYFGFDPHSIMFERTRNLAPPPTPPNHMRYFFHLNWKEKKIGCFSYGHRFGNMPGNAICFAYFVRGNLGAEISISFIPGSFYSKGAATEGIGISPGQEQDELFEENTHFLNPDPREIAWRIDQYLVGDPLEKFSEEEKQKLKTLEITLPQEDAFELGKEYPLDFPRKSSDGTVPAEIRLVVSRGEIQQVLDVSADEDQPQYPNPASRAPDIDGDYTVLFGKPEKQTVHCYHINEEGKCLAWGEIEVFVKKSINPKSE